MRVLFVTTPVIAHTYPLVTTAWALRAAGHDVLVATCGATAPRVARAGLAVTDTAPGLELGDVFRELAPGANPFAVLAERMLPGVLAAGRPDAVVFTPHAYAGPRAAAEHGVPAVVHGLGLGPGLDQIRETYAGAGVAADFAAGIDVAPDSMRVGERLGWSARYVPFNEGSVLPAWVREPAPRRRVLVTLGTTVPSMVGLARLTPLWKTIDAAADVDAEFVIALGDIDTTELGELPPNVRVVPGWLPLIALLRTCDAAVHHGGSGTLMAVLDAGLPQLVLPQGADQFANAEAVRKRGVGLVRTPDGLSAAAITELLGDGDLRAAAAEVRAELRALPAPSALVDRLTGLV
ncbi:MULTISPECIES: glycosyltransferase [Actinokineospora]|uniref:Glycosyl transferase n=1 Tax=Actinokineospora fastidiosa TaxID=1816 RepID=A0A918GM71_9PSEU|nr:MULTISPECIES: nucleotide disphospho-sugar-binding domain-containing protein [Actinokineospora]UVS78690.1 Glycosyltransferase PerS8 [Actinokineospora sp. UTMC 2448]GGS46197.1 glycosyl transferase [Actinokineospora fastidiosa]